MKGLVAGVKARIGKANRKAVAGVVVLALLSLPTMAFAWNAAEKAAPGSALYGLHRAQERLAVRLSGGHAARAVRLAGLAGERLKETATVLSSESEPANGGSMAPGEEDTELADDLLADYAEEMQEAQDELDAAEEVDPDDAVEYSGKLTDNQEALKALVDMVPTEVLDALRQALQVTSDAQLDNTAVLVKLIEGAPQDVVDELREAIDDAIEAQKELAEETDNLGENDKNGEIRGAQIDTLEALLKIAPPETYGVIKQALATLKAAEESDDGSEDIESDDGRDEGQEVKRSPGTGTDATGHEADNKDEGESVELDSGQGDSGEGSSGEGSSSQENRQRVNPDESQDDVESDEPGRDAPSAQNGDQDEGSGDHESTGSPTQDTDD